MHEQTFMKTGTEWELDEVVTSNCDDLISAVGLGHVIQYSVFESDLALHFRPHGRVKVRLYHFPLIGFE